LSESAWKLSADAATARVFGDRICHSHNRARGKHDLPAVQQGAGKQHPPARFGYLPTDIRGQNRRRPDLSFPNHRPPGAI